MYKRSTEGWFKHIDFIILDELALQLAYIMAYWIRQRSFLPYDSSSYRSLAIVLILMDLLAAAIFNTMHNVLKRGYFKEFTQTLKHALIVFTGGIIFIFSTQTAESFSRIVLYLTFGFHLVIGYAARLLLKKYLVNRGQHRGEKETMLVVLNVDSADAMIDRLTKSQLDGYQIVGVVLDRPERNEIRGIPVVTRLEDAANYICREWIDSVYIDCTMETPGVKELMAACREMAVPVHYHIPGIGVDGSKQFAEKLGGTTVLTTTANYATLTDVFAKRALDIFGGLVGSLFALIIIAIVGPKIKKASPGPILYQSERIGQNGKKFKMSKIRSMYLDADARKAELMEQNRVKDGMMFKIEFDPRVIGNELLPDGTKKTGIGEFIRKTSLDEFPQFFNVLKGEMSLVGTRPPTPDEWEKYEFHHRARLACKPGITGMWQVSGRSEITDFEEVVRLDTEYINNWSLGLDLKILLKTVGAVFAHKGAM
ncbi:MAG: sugar transferase [Clostridia bacterium]|nr:sugar transferase [Clostridia bacterium]